METKDSTIKVCEGLYSTSIYEMDVWTLPTDNEDSEEDYMWQLENEGYMDCGLRRELTGLFRTKERALEDLDKALDNHDGLMPMVTMSTSLPIMCCPTMVVSPTLYVRRLWKGFAGRKRIEMAN